MKFRKNDRSFLSMTLSKSIEFSLTKAKIETESIFFWNRAQILEGISPKIDRFLSLEFICFCSVSIIRDHCQSMSIYTFFSKFENNSEISFVCVCACVCSCECVSFYMSRNITTISVFSFFKREIKRNKMEKTLPVQMNGILFNAFLFIKYSVRFFRSSTLFSFQ